MYLLARMPPSRATFGLEMLRNPMRGTRHGNFWGNFVI